MTGHRRPARTEGQRAALRELRDIARQHPTTLLAVRDRGVTTDGALDIAIRLATGTLERAPGGLALARPFEELILRVSALFPHVPPAALVQHERFLGYPHVLQGERLCVYLDPGREWHPGHGIREFLNRLWDWLADAAAGRFDSSTALYHPVGGVLHQTKGTPTIVVRHALPRARPIQHVVLTERSIHRFDLATTRGEPDSTRNGKEPLTKHTGLLLMLQSPLSCGAGTTVATALNKIAAAGSASADALLDLLAHAATRNTAGAPTYLLVAVEHPDQPGRQHLIGGRLPATLSDELRTAAQRDGPLLQLSANDLPYRTAIEWCAISEERAHMSTRRDATRPVTNLAGRTVEIWGCGGLGSWLAEFAARAGAASIVLRDHRDVSGGLLVRQNYVENDIGANKANRLAMRLRQIADGLIVESHPMAVPIGLNTVLPDCDVIIDATVVPAVGAYLDAVGGSERRRPRPLLAQVATDIRTGTLGMLTVRAPDTDALLAEIDQQAGHTVGAHGELERFQPLWQESSAGEELIPAPGCSVPTYHGSAADLAAVAASLISLLGPHVDAALSGTHLVALPHAAGTGPHHHFVPVD